MAESALPLHIVVVGASGDLARRKVIPALFALACQGYLPQPWRLYGFARSELDDNSFRRALEAHLTCRYVPERSCARHMRAFLARCHYVRGDYAARDAFLDLYERMRSTSRMPAHLLFYLAVPSTLFGAIGHALGGAGLVSCGPGHPAWSRVVIEKPFGRDRTSSDDLARRIGQVFSEQQTFRIDHYLGKEVVQNLLVMRFANLVFEPFWNRLFVRSIHIEWNEDLPVTGRGAYFDAYGIVRDVVQNHLLQILALLTMERPAELNGTCIRAEKARVLRRLEPLRREDILLGQYTAGRIGKRAYRGYRQEEGVAPDSRTPTYAALALRLPNRRWQGVPILISAGKGLDRRLTRIRIRFKEVPGGLFHALTAPQGSNEVVIRVQPDEAIFLKLFHKIPGLDLRLGISDFRIRYEDAFRETIPEAYERLLLDVLQNDQSLFIRKDELDAAWDVFSPWLGLQEKHPARPRPYPFGSRGPKEWQAFARRHGIEADA